MDRRFAYALLIATCLAPFSPAAQTDKTSPRRVRIGVDVRMSFQSCIDYWQPVAEQFSKAIPEYRFVVVPLASHQDIVRTLEKGDVDFLAVDPAMELVAEDRFGAVPLATIIEARPGETHSVASDAASSGAIIRRTDRPEIQTLRDLRGLRIAAVKPWSLTGWIAQWGLLVKDDVNPQTDLKDVVFEGTHQAVVKGVLDGTADAGVLDAEILRQMADNGRIPQNSLCIMNRQGRAVPLLLGEFAGSTAAYPGRLFSKTAATPDDLAKRVAETLMTTMQRTTLDGMPVQIRWTVPCNYSKVRYLLQNLMGPQFADTNGYPPPWKYPTWLFPATVVFVAASIVAIVLAILRGRFGRREDNLIDQLEATRKELLESRAEKQRLDAILAIAGCGIDIVDDNDQIIYADAEIERRYGDWRGKKCYEYYCGQSEACAGCHRPGPLDDQEPRITDFDCVQWAAIDDPHVMMHGGLAETTRIIGIPFYDEGGRWLYARMHFPAAVLAGLNAKANTP